MIITHPGFDPIAIGFGPFHIAGMTLGPFAIRWYVIMYLVAFMLVIVLGKMRAKQNMLTGWRTLDVDDMLYYGVFGTILGGRLGYVLFYKPLYYLAHPAEIIAASKIDRGCTDQYGRAAKDDVAAAERTLRAAQPIELGLDDVEAPPQLFGTRQSDGMGWILESNRNMNRAMGAMGGRVVRRFRVYERDL